MEDVVVACNTLEDEIKLVFEDIENDYPIYWVDSGLHNFPEKLKNSIQEEINKIDNADHIILLFGSCGNSLVGLHSSVAPLVIPKVADCISMFLGGDQKKQQLERKAPGYYFTGGYLENESNIWAEFQYSVEKYGKDKASYLFQKMLHNYQKLRIIDTGAYNPQLVMAKTEKMADEFNLEQELVRGTLKYIYKALNREWDQDFVIIEAGRKVTFNDIGYFDEN